jgi:UDP-N-acetylmuramate--alanine ligase
MSIMNIKQVYFIGIGGIGMSALARFFNEKGCKVSGYDRTPTPLTRQLEAEGIGVHYEENLDLINQAAELVVYTPAIPADHQELVWYREHNYKVVKRSDVLQEITQDAFSICIAGTHGKTTITSMVAHILRHSGVGCNAFLGGIAVNYNSNYWSYPGNNVVVEADEYDRSFLKLFPNIAVLTSLDADHLDIYGTHEAMMETYIQFTGNIKPDGILIHKHGLPKSSAFKADEKLTYSASNDYADVYAKNIIMRNGTYTFDVAGRGVSLQDVHLNIGGLHNVENCIAAIAVAKKMDVEDEDIKAAVAAYQGVKRRFEYIYRNDKVVYIDDYAHHPQELKMLIQSAKSLFPGKKVNIIFQPHLYSRTRDLADGFAHSLDLADNVILMDIYPARELPMEGVTSQMILDKMINENKHILSRESVLRFVESGQYDVLITAGAGDIDKLVDPIRQILEQRFNG